MKEEDLKGLLLATASISGMVCSFFAGVAIRDDIFTYQTAVGMISAFSLITTITVLIFTYKFEYSQDEWKNG